MHPLSFLHIQQLSSVLSDLIEFGWSPFSIGTAKRVFQGLQGKNPKVPLVRNILSMEGHSYIRNSLDPKDIGEIRIHRSSPMTRDIIRKILRPGQDDEIAAAMHERGHAYDPGLVASHTLLAKRVGDKLKEAEEFRNTKAGKIIRKSVIGREMSANHRVLSQIKKHGTPQEIEAWKRSANEHIESYRHAYFTKPTEGKTLSQKKKYLRENPYIRKSQTQLSELLTELIEFKIYQPEPEDEPPKELPEFTEGEPVDYTVQRHAARRAGLHRDIRIGTKRHGLLSWASRKQLPGPGEKIAIHPQPIHPHDYLGWEGNIPSGYGAGDVKTESLGKALVTESSPTEVHATMADQREHHRMAFLKTAKGWLLTRGKHPEPPMEAQKPPAKDISPEKASETIASMPPRSIAQPKIDGALVYVTTKGNRPEVFSHRKGKQTGRHILHTERFFHGRPTTNIPKEHQRTLIGELYGTRGGEAIEPQELGGILNTHLGESISKQKQRGVDLKIMPFDTAEKEKLSYPERLARVKETLQHLPPDKFHAPEEATSQEEVKSLFNRIRKGRHPLTKEGIIIHPPEGKMIKIKNTEEANVPITGTYPGEGKYKESHGGFTYPEGNVGTGFSDETRRRLHEYIGRQARIKHQGRFKSGAYRAPSFIAVEENK